MRNDHLIFIRITFFRQHNRPPLFPRFRKGARGKPFQRRPPHILILPPPHLRQGVTVAFEKSSAKLLKSVTRYALRPAARRDSINARLFAHAKRHPGERDGRSHLSCQHPSHTPCRRAVVPRCACDHPHFEGFCPAFSLKKRAYPPYPHPLHPPPSRTTTHPLPISKVSQGGAGEDFSKADPRISLSSHHPICGRG